MNGSSPTFPGFDRPLDLKALRLHAQTPDRVYSLEGKRFVAVNLDRMTVVTDEGREVGLELNRKFAVLSPLTRKAAAAAMLHALDGKRKASTTTRWIDELSLFLRTVSGVLDGARLSTITLAMFQWYCSSKGASQQKQLRGALLYWWRTDIPGIATELGSFLLTTAPPKPRGMIEVQNSKPSERPLSMEQVRSLLSNIDQLYASGVFDPQTNALWRLMISEALRPSQMQLLQFGDVRMDRSSEGKLLSVSLMVPTVKQQATRARDYMTLHRLSEALGQAIADHVAYAEDLHGAKVPADWALFGIRNASTVGRKPLLEETPAYLMHIFERTAAKIAALDSAFEEVELFNRRFKHTKLTHLAAMGASLEVLAHAGYQTSTISLRRYVNLSDEAFAVYEEQLEETHIHINNAFRGQVIARSDATRPDPEHRILDQSMEDDVGACAAEPCEVIACLGCYLCPRFEAFNDGPHRRVEASLVAEQERTRAAGLPETTVQLRANILSAVRDVIVRIDELRRKREGPA